MGLVHEIWNRYFCLRYLAKRNLQKKIMKGLIHNWQKLDRMRLHFYALSVWAKEKKELNRLFSPLLQEGHPDADGNQRVDLDRTNGAIYLLC